MQLLAYIVVLAVSVSTILLELHWLTSPAPQPKPTVQSSTAPPVRVEGPNVELSPVYPRPEAPRSVGSVTGSPQAPIADVQLVTVKPAEVQPVINESTKGAPETTGSAAPSDTPLVTAASTAAPASQSPPAVVAPPAAKVANVAAKNQCDVAACAGAYSSFRASDCTYQPFEGARQLCVKPPLAGQKAPAKPREANSRKTNGDDARESKKAELQRAVQFLRGRRPSDESLPSQTANEPGGMVLFGRPDWR